MSVGAQVPSEKPEYTALSSVDARGPLFAVATVGVFLVFVMATGSKALNPTGYLGFASYALLYVVTIPAKEALNAALVFFAELLQLKRIDKGEGKVKKLEKFDTIDYCYLGFNTLVEFVGMNHVIAFLIQGPVVARLQQFSLTNGPIAFMLTMILNDVIYYPVHCVAHKRAFYPFCHKQHHRQFVPFRGYQDAANQHPFEQIYGFSIFLASCHVSARLTGFHAGAAWVAFFAWAILNIANHLPFDSGVHLPLPYPAYPHDHQMHHRFPQCNYSTLTSMCDRMFGTFRAFRALDEPEPPEPPQLMWWENLKDPADMEDENDDKEPPPIGRPDFCPSHWSVLWVTICIFLSTCIIEWVRIGEFPDWHVYSIFAKAFIVMFNCGLLCYAVESACAQPVDVKDRSERLYTKPTMQQREERENKNLQEAVPRGLHKRFVGGKTVFRPSLKQAIESQSYKRE